MLNIREIIRRFVKYIIMVLVVGFACYSFCQDKTTKNREIVYVALVSGITYCILDIITPSINLKINKNNHRRQEKISGRINCSCMWLVFNKSRLLIFEKYLN